jgi:translation elongation factor EF-1alpha
VLSPSGTLGSFDLAIGFAQLFFCVVDAKFCSVLTKGTSAEVQITIRQAAFAGAGVRSAAIPLEPFSTNKEMGRILIRRGGETIAAGKYPSQFYDFTCLM